MLGFRVLFMVRKNLLYFRKKVKNKSLDEMSIDIGISRDTLHRLENNNDSTRPLYPNLKTLLAITNYFGVELSDFLSKDYEFIEEQSPGNWCYDRNLEG